MRPPAPMGGRHHLWLALVLTAAAQDDRPPAVISARAPEDAAAGASGSGNAASAGTSGSGSTCGGVGPQYHIPVTAAAGDINALFEYGGLTHLMHQARAPLLLAPVDRARARACCRLACVPGVHARGPLRGVLSEA